MPENPTRSTPDAVLRSLLPRAGEVCAGLSEEQANQQPRPGAWSVAECIAHLNQTNRLYSERIAAAIEDGKSRKVFGVSGTPPNGLGAWFARGMEPPYTLKFKAPVAFQPTSSRYQVDQVLAEWDQLHHRLLQLVAEADGLDWKRVKVQSPVSKFVRTSLAGSFGIIGAHDRRHLWQAEQVRKLVVR